MAYHLSYDAPSTALNLLFKECVGANGLLYGPCPTSIHMGSAGGLI